MYIYYYVWHCAVLVVLMYAWTNNTIRFLEYPYLARLLRACHDDGVNGAYGNTSAKKYIILIRYAIYG